MKREPRATRQPRPTKSRPNFISYHASRQNAAPSPVTSRQAMPEQRATKLVVRSNPLRLALVVVVLLVVLYSFTLSSSPAFILTNPSGVPMLRSKQTYQEAAASILGGSLSNMTKITINTDKIAREMQAKFPELETVEVVLPFAGRTPTVEAVTTRPVLRLVSSNGTYLIDSKGRAIIDAKDALHAKELAIPAVEDRADLKITEGQGVLSTQDVTFITTIAKQFAARKVSITSMELPPLASELHIRMSGQPYYVKFNMLTNPSVAAGQYFALMTKLQKDGTTPKEYVDSRVEEKVFYK